MKRGENFLIIITRDERDALVSMGVKLRENGISKTTSRHSGITYYLTESDRNIYLLSKIRPFDDKLKAENARRQKMRKKTR